MTDETLWAALARAQLKFTKIAKDHQNPHFKSQYADVADVLDVVRPALASEGIALLQPVVTDDTGTYLCTVLAHPSQVYEAGRFPMPTGMKPQDALSWLTYMRRGLACSALGIHPSGEDDDGNAAQDAPSRATGRDRAPAAQWGGNAEAATENQQKAIAAKLGALGASKKDEKVALLKHLTGHTSTKDLTKQQASDVFDTLKPFEDGAEWGMFVWDNAGQVSIVGAGEEPFGVPTDEGAA